MAKATWHCGKCGAGQSDEDAFSECCGAVRKFRAVGGSVAQPTVMPAAAPATPAITVATAIPATTPVVAPKGVKDAVVKPVTSEELLMCLASLRTLLLRLQSYKRCRLLGSPIPR